MAAGEAKVLQTSRPAPMMLLSLASRMGVKGGKPPRQPLPGITRSVAPKSIPARRNHE